MAVDHAGDLLRGVIVLRQFDDLLSACFGLHDAFLSCLACGPPVAVLAGALDVIAHCVDRQLQLAGDLLDGPVFPEHVEYGFAAREN